ncbi:MAG: hypothetical protein GT601_08340 [Acidaminobacter sp.]|uniref:hypothetical protein n=1 Tax=Acidaminobacter sp. TaxID=1872102 RepID=UPI00138021AE|nr:hypothetical protein [Acidaminobacter sp.]MZQ97672.1 hypothetical protein [Acidaminobacter sp.]
MNLIGQKVSHKAFGVGTVTDQSGNHLTVDFKVGEKKFPYPNAFENFLNAIDPSLDDEIKKVIEDNKQAEIEEAELKDLEKIKEASTFETVDINQYINSERGARNYFFVFQNKTYDAEKRGGYLWAPKSLKDGRNVAHWNRMTEVRKGDVIFHSVRKEITAISIATSDCYSANQPEELKREKLWDDDGWKVDCCYIVIKSPIVTSDYKDAILELQPILNAPFNVLGRGNTGYLFSSNVALSKFLFDKMKIVNGYLAESEDMLF